MLCTPVHGVLERVKSIRKLCLQVLYVSDEAIIMLRRARSCSQENGMVRLPSTTQGNGEPPVFSMGRFGYSVACALRALRHMWLTPHSSPTKTLLLRGSSRSGTPSRSGTRSR